MSDIITNTTSTNESKVFNVYVSKSTTAGTVLVTRGSLNKTDPKPTVVGLYILEETGIYPNLGNIDAQAGKLNFASFDGTTWSLVSVDLNASTININQIRGVESFGSYLITSDQCTWVTGYYLDPTSGDPTSLDTFSYCSNYIPIVAGYKYRLPTAGYTIIFYDTNKINIGSFGGMHDAYEIRTITAPANAFYMRINQINTNKTSFIVDDLQSPKFVKIPELVINEERIAKVYDNIVNLRSYISSFSFSSYPITGNVIISGDSTIGAYMGQNAVASYSTCSGTKSDISNPGDTIAQQVTKFNALSTSIKTNANYVLVQIGLNDLNPAVTLQSTITELQNYINLIKTNCPSAKIIIGQLLPCKQRLINYYGATNGINSFNKWFAINEFIEKEFIININNVSKLHTSILSDGSYNLNSIFDTGDGIHENNEGRKIIAYSFLASIL